MKHVLRWTFLVGLGVLLSSCASAPSDRGWLRNTEFSYLHQDNHLNPVLKLPKGMTRPVHQKQLPLPQGATNYPAATDVNMKPPSWSDNVPIPEVQKQGKVFKSTLKFLTDNQGILTVLAPYAQAYPALIKAAGRSNYKLDHSSAAKGLLMFEDKAHKDGKDQKSAAGLFVQEKNSATQVVVIDANHNVIGGDHAMSILKQIRANLNS